MMKIRLENTKCRRLDSVIHNGKLTDLVEVNSHTIVSERDAELGVFFKTFSNNLQEIGGKKEKSASFFYTT